MESLEHLLTTNQAPTDDERGRLKETLAEYDKKLEANAQKILALEEQLRSLNEENMALLEVTAPIRRGLSPFRQLPEDVVRAIFVACLETRRNPTMANTEAPVLLTQISRATRMIALTTPELWAAIHIPIITFVPVAVEVVGDPAESIMTTWTEGVKEWLLQRSGNLPLHISVYENIEYGRMYRYINPEITDVLIDVLVACSSRWKNVHFSCRPTTISHLSSLNNFDVPLLQSLTITSVADIEGEDNFWRDSNILKAPMLKRFRQLVSSTISIFPVDWGGLTHLYCTQINPSVMNELVCTSPDH